MIDTERLDLALTGAARVVGLVGPAGTARTALVREHCTRPDVARRFRDIGWITLGPPPPAPAWMLWPDTPAAAELTLRIGRTLRQWDGDAAPEPVAPDRAAAALAAAGEGRLLVVDGVRTAEQAAMFDEYAERGRLLLITEHVSLLPRGAIVVWASTDPAPASPPAGSAAAVAGPPVTDPAWVCRRLAEEGAPGLAVDLAHARAAGADPAVGALARRLLAEEDHFSGVRDARTLAALVADRLGMPTQALHPGPPFLSNRWPAPGRFGAALLRRLTAPSADHGLSDLVVTGGGLWTATTGGVDGGTDITLWDPLAGRRRSEFRLPYAKSVDLLPAPDDSWLAVTVRSDRMTRVSVIDPVAREVRAEIPGSVAVAAPDGSWVAVGDHRGEVRVHDTTGGAAQLQLIAAHWAAITALAVAPDGSWLASASEDGTVRIVDARTGRPRRALPLPRITRLTVTPDGDRLVAAGPYGVHVIDPRRGTDRRLHPGGTHLHALTVSDRWVAAAYDDRGVSVLDIADGSVRQVLPVDATYGVRLVAAPDGSWLAAGYPMRIWDPLTGTRRHGFPAGAWSGRTVAPDGSWMAAHVGSDIVVLDLTCPAEPGADPAHADPVAEVAIDADGRWFATRAIAGSSPGSDGDVRFWSLADGGRLPEPAAGDQMKCAGELDPGAAAVSADGRWLAVLDGRDDRDDRDDRDGRDGRDDRDEESGGAGDGGGVPGGRGGFRGVSWRRGPWLGVLERATGREVAATPVVDGPEGCRWSPDGSALVVWGRGGVQGLTWVTEACKG
ncbi:WD40 repeat domain-containing protein [Actinoplanes sp. DH11]|uniref:WD40 repeat domain-containing protein n=1 Tax=Actinoplanes sp. DH11 TaxID=2857011 RepID=UPI001E58BB6A|nr:WD40 repeat domain-containing protein [Actinoplanes sp. DH11]